MRNLILKIILISILVFSFGSIIYASTADELQKQINDANSQIQALDKQIKEYQDQISATSGQASTLAGLIKELTLTRTKLVAEKTQTEKKINATNLVISKLDNDIKTKVDSIESSEESLGRMLVELYRNDNREFIEKLLSKETLADASREYNNTVAINENVRQHVLDLKEAKQTLDISKDKKEVEKSNLTKLQKDLIQKQKVIDIAKKEKDTLLTETKNKEASYKKLLAEEQKKRDAFEKSLQAYEAQLKFILDPKTIPTASSGVLGWPLDSIFITQLFGKTASSGRLYVSGSHSGVDFRASIGTPVKSLGDGVVEGTGDTDTYCKGASFGKWVFIKYDNGLSSAFGHLSVISATQGQRVKAGDVVALSGNTGHSTGPHLHVTVYASAGASVKAVPSLSCSGKSFIMPIAATSAYLDPMLYFPSISSSFIKNDTRRD